MEPYEYILLIVIVASIWGPNSKEDKAMLKYFPVFLSIMLVVEIVGTYMSNHKQNNVFIYNLENVFETGFYLFFLDRVINEFRKKNKSYLLAIVIYIVGALVNIFFIQGRYNFHSYTFIIGSLFAIVLCLQYFIYILRYSKFIILTRDPIFWIVTALMFYHSLMLPLFTVYNFTSKMPLQASLILFRMINYINYIFLLILIIGFLCKRKFLNVIRYFLVRKKRKI
jgi:hypothetical protein